MSSMEERLREYFNSGSGAFTYNEIIQFISNAAITFPDLNYHNSQQFRTMDKKDLMDVAKIIFKKFQNVQKNIIETKTKKFNFANKRKLDVEFAQRMKQYYQNNANKMFENLPDALGFSKSNSTSVKIKIQRSLKKLELLNRLIYEPSKRKIVDIYQRGNGYQPKEITTQGFRKIIKDKIDIGVFHENIYQTEEYQFLLLLFKKLSQFKTQNRLNKKINKLYQRKTPKMIANKLFSRIKAAANDRLDLPEGQKPKVSQLIKFKMQNNFFDNTFDNDELDPIQKLKQESNQEILITEENGSNRFSRKTANSKIEYITKDLQYKTDSLKNITQKREVDQNKYRLVKVQEGQKVF